MEKKSQKNKIKQCTSFSLFDNVKWIIHSNTERIFTSLLGAFPNEYTIKKNQESCRDKKKRDLLFSESVTFQNFKISGIVIFWSGIVIFFAFVRNDP